MPLAEQPVPEVRPSGPRTKDGPSQISNATTDRDRTVSRRSEPGSRTTLIGGPPEPGTFSSPGCDEPTSSAKPPRRWTLGEISLLSPGSFYPLSDGVSTHYHLITNSNFVTARLWSQLGWLCVYTLCAISIRAEPALSASVFLEAPPRSNCPPDIVPDRIHGRGLETRSIKWYPCDSMQPDDRTSSLPPILYIMNRSQYQATVSS